MENKQHYVVALTWTLQDTLGEELDVLDDPVEFLVGGDDLFDDDRPRHVGTRGHQRPRIPSNTSAKLGWL